MMHNILGSVTLFIAYMNSGTDPIFLMKKKKCPEYYKP